MVVQLDKFINVRNLNLSKKFANSECYFVTGFHISVVQNVLMVISSLDFNLVETFIFIKCFHE